MNRPPMPRSILLLFLALFATAAAASAIEIWVTRYDDPPLPAPASRRIVRSAKR